MDLLQFFASIVGSLAWPVAIVVVVLAFRGKVAELLPNLRLKHGETEIDFRLDKAEKKAEALPPPTVPATPPSNDAGANENDTDARTRTYFSLPMQGYEEMVGISPPGAMVMLRSAIELTLRQAVEHAQGIALQSERIVGPMQMLDVLTAHQKLSKPQAEVLRELISIGNLAAHAKAMNVSAHDAIRYREIAERALGTLEWPNF